MEHEHSSNPNEVNHQPLPLKVYVATFLALLFLTFVTVFIAQFHFGEWNLLVAMAVAVAKASLVVLYFMGLKHDHDRFPAVVFLTGLFFLGIFMGPTIYDYFTRDVVDPTRGEYVQVTRDGYPPGVSVPIPVGESAQNAE
ncbi:MAG TPA: cytochrome C oxidase subunit IV family protein [Vulgatibacter sp.]|nr:cytochrome C oxidase subunit IV family protein [Vulgatibacter sp.]